MKDENGIDVCCENCEYYNGRFCEARETYPECNKGSYFNPTIDAYKAHIAELEKKLTETIKLFGASEERERLKEVESEDK